jgi:hypothetical protein
MSVESRILDLVDLAVQEALASPETKREEHYLRKAVDFQREILHSGWSLQELADIGSTLVECTRMLLRQLEMHEGHGAGSLH